MKDPIRYELRYVSDAPLPAVAERLPDGRIIVDVDESLPEDEQQDAIEAVLHPYRRGWRQALPLLLVAEGWEVAASWMRGHGQAISAVGGAAAMAASVAAVGLTGTVDNGSDPQVAQRPAVVASTSRTAARPERTVKHGPPDRGSSTKRTRPPATRRQEPAATSRATPPPTASRTTAPPTVAAVATTRRPTATVEAVVEAVVEETRASVDAGARPSPTVESPPSPAESGSTVESASCGGIHAGLPPIADVCVD